MAVDPAASAMTVQQVLGQVALIQQIMGAAMKDGEHYGKIPGCGDKPTLLKPGAEKLCLTFRLAPTYDVDERTLDRGHREYRVQCTLSSILTGAFIGQGVGICSTMEAKYRFRQGAAEPTDKPVPRAYWDVRGEDPAKAQELIGGKGFTVKKVDGKGWMIAKGGEKVETRQPRRPLQHRAQDGQEARPGGCGADRHRRERHLHAGPRRHHREHRGHRPGGPVAPLVAASPRRPPRPSRHAVDREERVRWTPSDDLLPEPASAVDFRETRIHFGKNRGLMLSELTPQQVHWYETDWMPKKEVNGPTSVEDLALMQRAEGVPRVARPRVEACGGLITIARAPCKCAAPTFPPDSKTPLRQPDIGCRGGVWLLAFAGRRDLRLGWRSGGDASR